MSIENTASKPNTLPSQELLPSYTDHIDNCLK